MRATRRTLLRLPLVLGVTGCASSPVIVGESGEVPAPEPPTRSDEATAVADWLAGFAAVVDGLAISTQPWGADAAGVAWLTALQEQSSAHLSRVVAENPVVGGPAAFPTPSASDATPPATSAEALALLVQEVAAGTPLLREAHVAAGDGQGRLFYASLTVAINASVVPTLPPVAGGARPAPFEDGDGSVALTGALGHARALISALELGLGRLPSSDDLQAAGSQRLDSAKALRNSLIANLTGDLPEVEQWEMPNAMRTAAEIVAAWAVLEDNLLQAFGALTAANPSRADAWLDAMLEQIPWIHRWGGQLPHWPGWADPS